MLNKYQLHFFSAHIKEAQEEKKRGLNKMQQAALLGGGAAMLGLGGLGYALHRGAKETNQIAKGVQDSISRTNKSTQAYNDTLSKARETDRIIANETRQAFKDMPDLSDSSGFEAAEPSKIRFTGEAKDLVEEHRKAPTTLGSDDFIGQAREAAREDLYEMMKLRDEAMLKSDGIKYEKYQKEVRRLATELGEDPDVWSVS